MSESISILKAEIVKLLSTEIVIRPEQISFTIPPQKEFGHFSSNLAFQLARQFKQPPIKIAARIKELLDGRSKLIKRIEVAGKGFLNFSLELSAMFNLLSAQSVEKTKKNRVIVEHTSINPNKAAHIGHLRNSILGDTLARILAHLGYQVEVQNYIDDTGIQMADVLYGLIYLKKLSRQEIEAIPNLADYLWELYPQVSALFEKDPQADELRRDVHRRIEKKEEPEFSILQIVARNVLLNHTQLMEKLGIRYDLVIHESDVLERDFFRQVAETLRQKKILYFSSSPDKKNCEVILYKKENIEKVVIRSNRTITYIGKDIAYHFWKFGLISDDFYYRRFYRYPDGKEILSSAPQPESENYRHQPAEIIYNVIDVRQSYLQNIISQVIEEFNSQSQNERYIHFSYEMVALSAESLLELGLHLCAEEKKRNFLEVSGRKGQAIKASTLLEKLIEKSLQEVKQRHPELNNDYCQQIAEKIAIGALRYFMLKYSLKTIIVFDFQEALNFEGDSGPYLQYTLVRINSILRKVVVSFEDNRENVEDFDIISSEEQSLIGEILSYLTYSQRQLEVALENRELALLAEHCFKICQKFNNYYHTYSILNAENQAVQKIRLKFIRTIAQHLQILLELMGIPVPEKM